MLQAKQAGIWTEIPMQDTLIFSFYAPIPIRKNKNFAKKLTCHPPQNKL
jgi:hypothetical protein